MSSSIHPDALHAGSLHNEENSMRKSCFHLCLILCCVVMCVSLAQSLGAATLCVNPHSSACYSTIQAAVDHASANDVINVAQGTYKEYVTIGIPVSIFGAERESTIVDASGLAHGFFVDGFHHAGLKNVTIAGLTVENADFEGIVVVSASDVTISNNESLNNDASPGLSFTGAPTGCPNQPGDGIYEN
ncbi:MAG: hypothetical protein JO347_11845, partial [Candidatus Eremiobacteraeota bacterium]|nr:hypothetical protein [Candidatus Eremiobacteraeota bacterium]